MPTVIRVVRWQTRVYDLCSLRSSPIDSTPVDATGLFSVTTADRSVL